MKKRKISFYLILIVFTCLGLTAQEATDWYLDKPIVDIQFENLSRIGENELRSLVRDYIGQHFTDSLSWEIMELLFSLDYFDMVETEIHPGDEQGNTIKLVYLVDEKPYINEIKFVGNRRIRRSELLDSILSSEQNLVDNGLINADKIAIEELYREEGFMDVVVEVTKELSVDESSLTVYFEIEEGYQTRIQEILFQGNVSLAEDRELLNLMETKVQTFFNKGLFNEALLQEDIININNFYRQQGFVDGGVSDIIRDIVLDQDEGVKNMVLTLVISEGDQYLMDEVRYSGNSLYSDEELDELNFLTTGEPVDLLKFERLFYSITDLYHENGYIFNQFDYVELRDEEAMTISYDISIIERERAHIASINISGNDKTREYVIRREIPIEAGDVYSKTKLQEAVMNLYNTGYFEAINPVPYQGSEDLLMDLELMVTEGRTADILFGMTFAGGPGFPVSGQLKWNDRNFLGSGKDVAVESIFSFDKQSLSLEYNEPWLFGVRWNGGFDVSYHHTLNQFISQDIDGNGIPDPYTTWEEYQNSSAIVPSDYQMQYDSHSVSGGFKTGYTWVYPFARIGISGSVRAGFTYIDYDQEIYRPYNENLIDNYHEWQYFDSLGLRFSWDKRNLFYDPTDGYIFSQSLTLGGIFDISTNEYIKSVTRIGFYETLFSIDYDEGKRFMGVLDFSSAFSYIFEKPWKDHHLALDSKGFSINGMFIGKGWSLVTGGKALWDNSLTIKFPIVPNVLAADAFIDGVGMWNSDEEMAEMHISDFRFSTGVGVRFANPAFPIGLYWVKKFRFTEDNQIDWNPEPNYTEFKDLGMDLVVTFELDMY